MAYTKQTWTTGDTITAAKLNHMEDGIADGGSGEYDIVIELDGSTDEYSAVGKSVSELYEMISTKMNVAAKHISTFDMMGDTITTYEYPVVITASTQNNVSTVSITFSSGSGNEWSIGMLANGNAMIAQQPYTFVYDSSTKTYTFTVSENSGG